MSCHLNVVIGFKRLAVAAAAFTFVSIVFASSLKAQTTTWKIQLDVTSGRVTYSLLQPIPNPAKDRCTFTSSNPISSAENLYVCPDDIVQWVVKSPDTNIELFLHFKEAILLDDEGDPAHGFHSSNKGAAGGSVDEDDYATPNVDHKYYVIVYDKDTLKAFYNDPKIIIGTGTGVEDVVRNMQKLCKERPSDSAERTSSKKLCKDVRVLVNRLHLE